MFEAFTGHEARTVDVVQLPDYDAFAKIGEVTCLGYKTRRDGKTEFYRHDFAPKSRPAFCVSHDGQQIKIVGGRYLFKDSGINDT